MEGWWTLKWNPNVFVLRIFNSYLCMLFSPCFDKHICPYCLHCIGGISTLLKVYGKGISPQLLPSSTCSMAGGCLGGTFLILSLVALSDQYKVILWFPVSTKLCLLCCQRRYCEMVNAKCKLVSSAMIHLGNWVWLLRAAVAQLQNQKDSSKSGLELSSIIACSVSNGARWTLTITYPN